MFFDESCKERNSLCMLYYTINILSRMCAHRQALQAESISTCKSHISSLRRQFYSFPVKLIYFYLFLTLINNLLGLRIFLFLDK